MLGSNLPVEILIRIAEFSTTETRLHSSLVCKAWRASFQDSLWDTIDISCVYRLNDICNIYDTEKSVFEANGYRVQELNLGSELDIDEEYLPILQKLFPNIKKLTTPQVALLCPIGSSFDDYDDHDDSGDESNNDDLEIMDDDGDEDYEDIEYEADWFRWKHLEELTVEIPEMEVFIELEDFIQIISFLPRLKKLSCITTGHISQSPYTLEDLETLNKLLPELEQLSLMISINPLSKHDIFAIKHITPAINMRLLEISTDCPDASWMHYFSRKYPNLNTLAWFNCKGSDRLEDTMESPTAPPVIPPGALSHLKKVSISNTPKEEATPYSLRKLLVKHGVQLSQLGFVFSEAYTKENHNHDPGFRNIFTYGSLRNDLVEYITPFGKSLESLSILAGEHNYSLIAAPNIISLCSRLVCFHLTARFSRIPFDILLDSSPTLKKVVLEIKYVFLGSRPSEQTETHGLEFVSLSGTEIKPDILAYISFRCRQLKRMYLRQCNVIGSISPQTGNLRIDMPFTNFDFVEFNGVYFGQNLGFSRFNTDGIMLMSIVQKNVSAGQDNYGTNQTKSASYRPPSPSQVTWVYIKPSVCHRMFGTRKLELKKSELKYVEAYMDSYENNWSSISKDKNSNRDTKDILLKQILQEGYVEFICQSIKGYEAVDECTAN
ncbi:hypothetical protein CLU79DRAFT_761736, partial [Phycomyces nitens]